MATFLQVCDAFPQESGDMQKDFKALKNYVYQLQESLRYVLCNLDSENFNDSGLQAITDPIKARIEDQDGNLAQLELTAEYLRLQLSNANGDISQLQQTAQSLQSQVTSADGKASQAIQTANGFETRVSNAEGAISQVVQTVDGVTVSTGYGSTFLKGDRIVMGASNTDNYSSLSYDGMEIYVNGNRKALLGENPALAYENQALILGTDNPGYVTKYYNAGHKLWIGNGTQTCGIMFDFSAGTYQLYGTQA